MPVTRNTKRTEAEDTLGSKPGVITVKICGKENGLEVYKNVKFVRVTSKQYNLLIMADYMPMIGDIEGKISFRDANREYTREGITGYFMHKNNEFSLMIKNESQKVNSEGMEDE